VIDALGEWGQRWARSRLGREDLDPGLLRAPKLSGRLMKATSLASDATADDAWGPPSRPEVTE
jgi:hypothetical protein